jgi:hypothetical protein
MFNCQIIHEFRVKSADIRGVRRGLPISGSLANGDGDGHGVWRGL